MKKKIVLTALCIMLLSSCGGSGVTSLKDVYSDTAINESVEYYVQNSGMTDTEAIKAQLDNMATYVKAADNLKLDITEELKSAKDNLGGEEGLNNAREQGVPESYITLVLNAQACNSALEKYMTENNLFAEVDTKEFFLNNYWRAKHVLVSTDGKDDSEKAEAKKKAEDIYTRAKAGEDFDALVAEYSEDPGSKSQPDGYVFTKNEMVAEFENGTKDIEVGEFNMVETNYGYHIIKRLAIDETPELYEQFYEQANIEEAVKRQAIEDFAIENA